MISMHKLSLLQCYLPFKVIVGVHIPAVMFLASVRSLLALYFYRDLPAQRPRKIASVWGDAIAHSGD